jgi:hypothetical protein
MKNRFLALAISCVALALGAGPAMAQDPVSGQVAEQSAASLQNAEANANSTQYNPSNTNISVRVFSPGDDGDVSQENNSYAEADATNDNDTDQSVEQSQSGSGGVALQQAEQEAVNLQNAEANAESLQVKPENKNINVRVLSDGDNGDVSQENNSEAKSEAENENELAQDITQVQSGGECCEPKKAVPADDKYPKYEKGDSCCGGTGIQKADQEAVNKQNAEADAKSTQIKPSNTNISVRVLSDGDNGDVSQENNSEARSEAENENELEQDMWPPARSGPAARLVDFSGK